LCVEEEGKVQDQRRKLRTTLDELANAEASLTNTHQQMHEERHKAFLEIGQLGMAKQTAQQHMLLAATAQRRLGSSGKKISTDAPALNKNKENDHAAAAAANFIRNTPLFPAPSPPIIQPEASAPSSLPSPVSSTLELADLQASVERLKKKSAEVIGGGGEGSL